MTIYFSLYKNNLSNEANQYRAVVQPTGTVTLDGVIDRMLMHQSTITRPDILAVLDNYYTAIEGLLLEGFNVVTPGVNYRASVKGGFNGQNDSFSPSRNAVEATISPGLKLRRAIRERASVQKQEANERRPNLADYLDVNSGELNNLITPGGMGQVVGYRLKFDPATHLAMQGDEYIPLTFFQIWDGERHLIAPANYAPHEFKLQPWMQ